MIKKVTDRVGLISVAAVASLICCLMGFSSGQTPEEKPRRVTTLDGLREELERVQLELLPIDEGPVVYDGGAYLFVPDLDDWETVLLMYELLSRKSDGGASWSITLVEDPDSWEMVVLDGNGEELLRSEVSPDYDPSRGALSLRLVLLEDWAASFSSELSAKKGSLMKVQGEPALIPSAELTNALSVTSINAIGPHTLGPMSHTVGSSATVSSDTPPTNSLKRVTNAKPCGVVKNTRYVDRLDGQDAWSGRFPSAPDKDSLEGPKRTIRAGLGTVSKKETLVIKGGSFSEGINVRGHKGAVVIRGDVRLARSYENISQAVAVFSVSQADAASAPTSTVTRVIQ